MLLVDLSWISAAFINIPTLEFISVYKKEKLFMQAVFLLQEQCFLSLKASIFVGIYK